jgi:alpha-mannosidase
VVRHVVLSAVKKSDLEGAVLVHLYEIAGQGAETPVQFLGRNREFREVNLLEENSGAAGRVLKIKPYEIRTVKIE